jgi:hypothetical protein
MRIAISGSHGVGKTTLAEALAAALPNYELVPEPYRLLEDEGYVFPETPSVEDFEAQLERSLVCLEQAGTHVIFDRCAVDLLGYLSTPMFPVASGLLASVEGLLADIDFIVFVPIEHPDRIAVPREDAAWRREVDASLRDIIVDDGYGFKVPFITVSGTTAERVQQVLQRMGVAGGSTEGSRS